MIDGGRSIDQSASESLRRMRSDDRRRRRCRRHVHRHLRSSRSEPVQVDRRCRRRAAIEADGIPRGLNAAVATRRLATSAIVHGTTVGTNALLERKGARTGLITTAGFPRRARDAPARPAAHLGAARQTSSRSCRASCGSRWRSARWPTARSARPSTPTRSRRGARTLLAGGAEAVGDRLRQLLRQSGERARRAEARARDVWPNAYRHRVDDDLARDTRVRARLDDAR